jgi:hypothetical protein
VLSALLRFEKSRFKVCAYLCIPIALLALYSLTNPYALTMMFHISHQDMVIPPMTRIMTISWVWILGGSGLLSLIGTLGILSSVRIDLVAVFGLLLGYVVISSASYYGIVFTPLFVGGLFLLFCKRRLHPGLFVTGLALSTMAMVFLSRPTFRETPARAEMRALASYAATGTLLIDGYFGHDWQYESPIPVRKFSQDLSSDAEKKADIFVCTKTDGCDGDINDELWVRLLGTPLPTWLRTTAHPSAL